MNITMNLYTKRERNVLESGVAPEVLAAGDISIDPLKVKVAELFPRDEWDIWYFRCSSVLNAIKQLSDYQPGPYHAPQTSSTYTMTINAHIFAL